MKSSLFYVIVALFATAHAVVVPSPGTDIPAENDIRLQRCKLPLSVSPRYGVAHGLHILLLAVCDKVTSHPSLPLNTSPSDNVLSFSRPLGAGL